jgi:two-component system cell cycle response regulator
MSRPWCISLLGFSAFERSALESCLRLAPTPGSRFSLVDDAARADVLIVDTEAALVREALPSAIWTATRLAIGSGAAGTCLAQLPRPINPLLVVRTLTGLLADRRPPPVAEPAPRRAPAPPSRFTEPDRAAAPRQRAVLVIDPSHEVLRFMATHLVRCGLEVRLARSGEDALMRVAERSFDFVFVARLLPGIDGWQACKLIKQRPYRSDEAMPRVVLMSERDRGLDRARAALAGCDSYLAKPLTHEALSAVFGELMSVDATHAQTAYAPLTRF